MNKEKLILSTLTLIITSLITCIIVSFNTKKTEIIHKNVGYKLINIKIDDDAEYHFILSNNINGSVIQETDFKSTRTAIIYSPNITEPNVIAHYSMQENSPNGWYLDYRPAYTFILPVNYNIEIFND